MDPHNIAVQIDNRTGRSTFKLMDFSKTFDIKAPLTTDRYMFNIYKGTKRGDYVSGSCFNLGLLETNWRIKLFIIQLSHTYPTYSHTIFTFLG